MIIGFAGGIRKSLKFGNFRSRMKIPGYLLVSFLVFILIGSAVTSTFSMQNYALATSPSATARNISESVVAPLPGPVIQRVSVQEQIRQGNETSPSLYASSDKQSGVDKFGVTMLYPTKAGGEEWFVNPDNPNDPRVKQGGEPVDIIVNPDLDKSWKITSSKVRLTALTTQGYDPSRITTTNMKELSKKGFIQSESDWKNVEMTAYIKRNDISPETDFTWYTHSGRHGNHDACEGTALKASLLLPSNEGDFSAEGKLIHEKEMWHPHGYDKWDAVPVYASDVPGPNEWVGIKLVTYVLQKDGNPAIVMETYIDTNNNNDWKLIHRTVDDQPYFGESGEKCGGAPNELISWGGPFATFRWDDARDVDIKKMSAREIQAPSAVGGRVAALPNATTTFNAMFAQASVAQPGPGLNNTSSPTAVVNASRSTNVQMATANNSAYMVWQNNNLQTNNESSGYLSGVIQFKRSIDGGVNFQPTINLSPDDTSANAFDPSISANGKNVCVAWSAQNKTATSGGKDQEFISTSEVYYTKSKDYGATFDPVIRVDNGSNANNMETQVAGCFDDKSFVAYTNILSEEDDTHVSSTDDFVPVMNQSAASQPVKIILKRIAATDSNQDPKNISSSINDSKPLNLQILLKQDPNSSNTVSLPVSVLVPKSTMPHDLKVCTSIIMSQLSWHSGPNNNSFNASPSCHDIANSFNNNIQQSGSSAPNTPVTEDATSKLNLPNRELVTSSITSSITTNNSSINGGYIVPLNLPRGVNADNMIFCATSGNGVSGSGFEQTETCKQVRLGPDKLSISPVYIDMSSSLSKFVASPANMLFAPITSLSPPVTTTPAAEVILTEINETPYGEKTIVHHKPFKDSNSRHDDETDSDDDSDRDRDRDRDEDSRKRDLSVCYFDPDNKECDPDEDGKCRSGSTLNGDGRCIPKGKCPDSHDRLSDDKSGKCYQQKDTKKCSNGTVIHARDQCPTSIPTPQPTREPALALASEPAPTPTPPLTPTPTPPLTPTPTPPLTPTPTPPLTPIQTPPPTSSPMPLITPRPEPILKTQLEPGTPVVPPRPTLATGFPFPEGLPLDTVTPSLGVDSQGNVILAAAAGEDLENVEEETIAVLLTSSKGTQTGAGNPSPDQGGKQGEKTFNLSVIDSGTDSVKPKFVKKGDGSLFVTTLGKDGNIIRYVRADSDGNIQQPPKLLETGKGDVFSYDIAVSSTEKDVAVGYNSRDNSAQTGPVNQISITESKDGGKTFGESRIVAADSKNVIHGPALGYLGSKLIAVWAKYASDPTVQSSVIQLAICDAAGCTTPQQLDVPGPVRVADTTGQSFFTVPKPDGEGDDMDVDVDDGTTDSDPSEPCTQNANTTSDANMTSDRCQTSKTPKLRVCPQGTKEVNGVCRTPRPKICPDGTTEEVEGICITPRPKVCPDGTTEVNGLCVAEKVGGNCPEDTIPSGSNDCVAEKIPGNCPAGYTPSPSDTNECLGPRPKVCDDVENICVPSDCPAGTIPLDANICRGPRPQVCPDGTTEEVEGICITPRPKECPDGTTEVNGLCIREKVVGQCPLNTRTLDDNTCAIDKVFGDCPTGTAPANGDTCIADRCPTSEPCALPTDTSILPTTAMLDNLTSQEILDSSIKNMSLQASLPSPLKSLHNKSSISDTGTDLADRSDNETDIEENSGDSFSGGGHEGKGNITKDLDAVPSLLEPPLENLPGTTTQHTANIPVLGLGILKSLSTSPDNAEDDSAITEQDKFPNDKDTSYDDENRFNNRIVEDSNYGKEDSTGDSNDCDRNYKLNDQNICVPAEDNSESAGNGDNNGTEDKNQASEPEEDDTDDESDDSNGDDEDDEEQEEDDTDDESDTGGVTGQEGEEEAE